MPKRQVYYDDDENFSQDWEPVVLSGGKKTEIKDRTKDVRTFGSQLIEARRLAQMTQHVLAQSMCVSLSTVETWENNLSRPTKSQIVRLNRVLRCETRLK